MNPAKQKSLDQIAADAGKFALRYADKMLYEMAEAVTDRIIPQGAEELGRGLVTQGLAFSPTANSLEPTDLPIHGDPSVWGIQITPSDPQPAEEVTPITTDSDPKLWNGLKMMGQAELARREPSAQEPSPMEPIGPSIDDKVVQGRDEFVHMLENPMQGFTAPEPEPEGPEPEPEPDLEPEW